MIVKNFQKEKNVVAVILYRLLFRRKKIKFKETKGRGKRRMMEGNKYMATVLLVVNIILLVQSTNANDKTNGLDRNGYVYLTIKGEGREYWTRK